ncbi:MAG: chloramphenicol phosphotransferase CPT family protein [Oscillospiraceae bacterium]|nr:chloramphenicol phosphotransferase CPT family protein [Oscillospiraceae bacterium]
MKKGKIIILNGTSSAGKSTLARVLQDRVSEAFFVISGDDYMQMLGRSKYVDISNESYIQYNLVEAYTAKALSDRGMNLIMDTVHFTDTEEEVGLKEWVELLRDNPVLFVMVTCPLEELRRREKERSDRDMRYDWDGKAESQIATLYPQDIYDITIDNHKNTNEECADKIIELLNCPEKFSAFKTLWLQRA